jgi:hypothetical protein
MNIVVEDLESGCAANAPHDSSLAGIQAYVEAVADACVKQCDR